MPIVVDCSALVFATTESHPAARRLLWRLSVDTCHAPHLIDAELGSVLARKVRRGELSPRHAITVLHEAPHLVDQRHGHRGALATAAWELRENVSFYDGLYVCLAIALGAVLLTLDRRLLTAPGLGSVVELVAP